MKIILGLAVLCALTVFNLAFASPPISLSCPCEVTQVNQTLFRADFGIVFDSETDETYFLEAYTSLAKGVSNDAETIASSSTFEVAYSTERQAFSIYLYRYVRATAPEGIPVLRLVSGGANGSVLAENLLAEEPIEIRSPEIRFGTVFGRSERLAFISDPSVTLRDERVDVEVDALLSDTKVSERSTYNVAIRAYNEDNSFIEKGTKTIELDFDVDGLASLNLEIDLERAINAHLDSYPNHTLLTLTLATDESTLVRYFLRSLDQTYEVPSRNFTGIQVLDDLDGNGFSDYLQRNLGDGYGSSRNDSAAVIEVGFTYGDLAMNEFGSSLPARINHVLSVANTAFIESGADVELTNVGEVDLGDDSQSSIRNFSLDALKAREGIFEELDAKFSRRPDLIIHLLADGVDGVAGRAVGAWRKTNGLVGVDQGYDDTRNVGVVSLGSQDLVLVHEVGHLLGLGHSRSIVDEFAGSSTYPWALGHGVDGDFVTIMGFRDDFNVNSRLAYFSNPQNSCGINELACGVDRKNLVDGADAVSALNVTAWQVSGYSNGFPPYLGYDSEPEIFLTSIEKLAPIDIKAFDSEDGDLSSKVIEDIKATASLDFEESYEQIFTVTDNDGNQARMKRTIRILTDTDSDGIADRDDSDDDGDGIEDALDAFPLIAIGSLLDTDGDGAPNDCDSACIASGMAADEDDDGDGFSERSVWLQLGEDIDGVSPGAQSGFALALSDSGGTVAIGAINAEDDQGTDTGGVRIYSLKGNDWVLKGSPIYGLASADRAGWAVDIADDGNIVAVGIPYNDEQARGAGQVRIYQWDGEDWRLKGLPIYGDASGDLSGISVSLSQDGNTLVVGAIYNGGAGEDAGQAKVFVFDGWHWMQRGLDINGLSALDYAGHSVSISADGLVVVVGSHGFGLEDQGQVRVFSWDGESWVIKGAAVEGSLENERFGYRVALSADSNVLAISGYSNAENPERVKIFERNGDSWSRRGGKLPGILSDVSRSWSVSLSEQGDFLALGSVYSSEDGRNGLTKVFHWSGEVWNAVGQVIFDESFGDRSGFSIDLSNDGNILAVGAYLNDGRGGNSGHVRIFQLSSIDLFPLDPLESSDVDADGVGDNADLFDDNPFEAFDNDLDGIGDNSDPDDDNDTFTDADEVAAGTDPLSASSCPGCFSFDIDDDGEAKALTDGLLVIRHLFGFSGEALTAGAVGSGAKRSTPVDIASYLTNAATELDIDGDDEAKALTDGLLLIRYLFGFTGNALAAGAVGEAAEREDSECNTGLHCATLA